MQPTSSLEAVAFDVDGTVAETEDLHRRAFNLAFAMHGVPLAWDASEYRRLLKVAGGKERIAHSLAAHRISLHAHHVAAIHATKTDFYAELLGFEGAPWRPGVLRIMNGARRRGVPLAIATTTTDSNLDPLFAPVMGPGWRSAFGAIVAGDAVARKKPAPDVYLEVVRRLGIRAANCVVFEDSAAGIQSARRAGCVVVSTPSAWLPDDDLGEADLRLEHLGDVGALWEREHPELGERWLSLEGLESWRRRRMPSALMTDPGEPARPRGEAGL